MTRRGFPVGTPRNRLSPEERQTILELLRRTHNGAAVTRLYNETCGKVTLPTVCAIRNHAIAAGELTPRRLKKCGS